jgi:hypothetical protein
VRKNLVTINKNIKFELGNVKYITKDLNLPDLDSEWDKFINQHFGKIEKHGQDWVRNHIQETLKQTKATVTRYNTMLKERTKAESNAEAEEAKKYGQGQ